MNNNSYAYSEVLEVLENMEEVYVKKIPKAFIEYLKENASSEYKKHIVIDKPLENQNLNTKTLNILAVINLKYWVETEEHKQELLAQYKDNEKKEIEKLSTHFDSNSIFNKTNEEKNIKSENQSEKLSGNSSLSNNLLVQKKSIFRRFIDYIKSKIFED